MNPDCSGKILVVDDEKNMRQMLATLLVRHGYQVTTAENGEVALACMGVEPFDFILCDVRMPGVDGMQFLERAGMEKYPAVVIMMSAYGSIDMAVETLKYGAYDFISKPFKTDEVLMTLKKAENREALRRRLAAANHAGALILPPQTVQTRTVASFGAMVGESKVMQVFFQTARKIAAFDTTVLITGESGTGKELVAQGIHQHSPRRDGRFVAVNCSSIPENLMESEFFGYLKGAFTGADKDKRGLFAEADGGTIFLDEIGELPVSMQVKLLRVLQEGEIRPVGSLKPIRVNVRVIAATSRNLQQEIASYTFREDLYFRLNVLQLRPPPLRERIEDLGPLCDFFLTKYAEIMHAPAMRLTPEAIANMRQHPWPGNVRELENVIQRSIVMTEGSVITADSLALEKHVPASGAEEAKSGQTLSLKVGQKEMEAAYIRRALAVTENNKSRAALLLEISYPSLLKKIKEYGITE